MGLKPSHKQTEAGDVPEDWQVVDAGSIGKFRGGNGFPTACQGASTGRYPFFKVSDMNNEGNETFMQQAKHYVSEETRVRIGANAFPPHTIVFAKVGAAVFLERKKILTRPSCLDNNMAGYVISDPGPNYRYVHYFLLNFQLSSLVSTTALPSLNGNVLRAIQIPLPPTLAEQQAIVEALSNADALIESLEQLLAKKRQIKQGAMQELLTGTKRLPGFSGRWQSKVLKTMTQTPVTDGPHLTPRFLRDGVPFLSVNNLVGNRIDLSSLRFISREDHATFSRKCKPQKGDLLLGKAASVGVVAIVDSEMEFNIWSPIALIRVSNDHSAKFVYYSFQTEALKRQIELLTNSSSQGNIGMGDIERLVFFVPCQEEQQAIADSLSDIDVEIEALDAKLTKARSLKQGMMQELLTGRIRLT